MNTIRAFIAIELPTAILARLRETQEQLKPQMPENCIRWVHTDGIHLTLKFLGDVPQSQLTQIKATLAQAGQDIPAFTFTVGQAGCFPNAQRPRVVWVGVQEPSGTLTRLRDAVEAAIAPLGYPTEDRVFHPHLTLGRVGRDASRDDTRQIGRVIAAANVGTLGQVDAREIALIQSHLKPTGAEYTPLMRAELKR
jgi:2'-5' RNA ligase